MLDGDGQPWRERPPAGRGRDSTRGTNGGRSRHGSFSDRRARLPAARGRLRAPPVLDRCNPLRALGLATAHSACPIPQAATDRAGRLPARGEHLARGCVPPRVPPCVLGPALRPCRPRERNYTIDDASHGIHTDPLHARRAPAAKHIRRGPPGATSGRDGRCARPERGARRTRPAVCAAAPRGVAGTSEPVRQRIRQEGVTGLRPPLRRGRFGSSFLRITRAAWPARDCGRGGRRVAAR